ncbi:hypothetical protein BJV82DRAFT_51891 [Fennellomyces sp. T-0311]|nr:hypothetical protein BJV82DRAFT_51891 [Fennellomyces sp. T-0311]
MLYSFVAFLATVYNASPFAAIRSDRYAMANSSSSSSTSPQPSTTASYRPTDPTEAIRSGRRRLLLSTTSTPNTPTLHRHPMTPAVRPQEARSRFTPPRETNEDARAPVLTDENWLPNRRFVRGDRLERTGPQDNLMLLAAEQAEQHAENALRTAPAERHEYQEAPQYPYRPQRVTTVAVTPRLETFITDATYVPTANISTTSEDEPFVLRLPARDARLAGQSVAEWAGSRKTKQRYAGSKRSCMC